MSILLADTHHQTIPFYALQARLQSVLQSLTSRIVRMGSNERQIIFVLFFEHCKKKEIQLQMEWTFQIDKEMAIFIQMRQNHVFCVPDQTISVNQLIARMNREIYDGLYYVHPQQPYLLKYRTKLPLEVANRYFASSIAHLYKQVEIHFINYALKIKILGNFTQPASDQTHKTLITMGKLKEHFELLRLKRPKATQYYDLNNCSIKIVNEALVLINVNLSLLKRYKNNEIKMDNKRRLDCQNSYQHCYKRYNKDNGLNELSQTGFIVSGIQVRGIIGEEKIDQSKFNLIYRGLYQITTNFTVNPSILTCTDSNCLQQEDGTAELVKKVSLSATHNDLSFNNQIDFLKFVRMKKSQRIAQYFMSLTLSNQVIDNSIYSRYYPSCLATKYVEWNERTLLRAGLQLIEGINFLSKNKILHRDLKQWNVLIDKQGNIKIIDFGSTSGVYGNKENEFSCKQHLMSTPTYYYPYGNAHKLVSKHYSKEEYNQSQTFDVYSFGVILSNLFSLENIFDCMLYRQLDYLSRKCREMNPEDRPRPHEAMVYLHQIVLLHMSENRAAYEFKGTL